MDYKCKKCGSANTSSEAIENGDVAITCENADEDDKILCGHIHTTDDATDLEV